MKTVITTIKPHEATELSLNVSQGIHPPFQTEYKRTLSMSSQKLENIQLSESKDELRAAQARAVMPLIGPLIDAWDAVCPSEQEEIDDISSSHAS